LLSFGNVSKAVPYILGPWLLINWLDAFANESGYEPCQLVYGDLLPRADVENSSGIAFGSQNIGLCNILYKSKVPGLLPVTKNNGRLILKEPVYKPGDNSCILRTRILPWAVDIEISEADDGISSLGKVGVSP